MSQVRGQGVAAGGWLCRLGAALHPRAMCLEADIGGRVGVRLCMGLVTTIGRDLVGNCNVPLRLPMSSTAIGGEIVQAQADLRLVLPPHPRPLRVVFHPEEKSPSQKRSKPDAPSE